MDREELKKAIIDTLKEQGRLNLYELHAELNKKGIMLGYSTLRLYVAELVYEGKLRTVNEGRTKVVEVV